MLAPVKQLANVWRTIRDVDLDAIRDAATAPFTLLIAGETLDDATHLRELLTPPGTPHHPWIVPVEAGSGSAHDAGGALVAILLSRQPQLVAPLAALRHDVVARGGRVIDVVLGDVDAPPGNPVQGGSTSVFAPAIDSRLARDLGLRVAAATGADGRLALAREIPAWRDVIITAIIEETSQANASYAFATGLAEMVPLFSAPLNVGDVIILTKNQLMMSYRIALAAGLDGHARRLIPEILGVLGGGLLLRQVARELVGLVPVIGLAPKVAVSYAGTYAIGRAVAAWALGGKRASGAVVRRWSQEGAERGRRVAEAIGVRRDRA
jgi:uncharacterized protein (DUF697 family)